MPDRLPGMPLGPGDVFVCSIGDGAPRHLHAVPQPPKTASAPAGVWLVLLLCPHCHTLTARYCRDHNATNWWLSNWGNP